MDIRAKFQEMLDEKKFSIRQLSIKSGVRRQSIMHFLSGGNIHIENLEKLLSFLGFEIAFTERKGTGLKKRVDFDKRALEKFCKEKGIVFLALFGSVLRDDFKDDSDIDIIITMDEPVSFFEFADIEEGLKKILKTDHKLDVVTKDGVSPLISEEIERNKEVLYDKAA